MKAEVLTRLNQAAQKSLVKLYLASPPKVQFALAKFGVRAVVKKKKAELRKVIRH